MCTGGWRSRGDMRGSSSICLLWWGGVGVRKQRWREGRFWPQTDREWRNGWGVSVWMLELLWRKDRVDWKRSAETVQSTFPPQNPSKTRPDRQLWKCLEAFKQIMWLINDMVLSLQWLNMKCIISESIRVCPENKQRKCLMSSPLNHPSVLTQQLPPEQRVLKKCFYVIHNCNKLLQRR